jgi:hypothetical protein
MGFADALALTEVGEVAVTVTTEVVAWVVPHTFVAESV